MSLPQPDVSVKRPKHCLASFYALPELSVFQFFRWQAKAAACIVDIQLEAVRQDICGVQGKIVKTKQNMAAADQAGNQEKNGSFFELLLSLYNQLLSLNDKENVLLRSQAPSKQCLDLVLACIFMMLHAIQ